MSLSPLSFSDPIWCQISWLALMLFLNFPLYLPLLATLTTKCSPFLMKLSVMATVWDRDQRQWSRNYPLVNPLGKDTRCNPPINLVQGIATSWHNSWYCYPHRPPAGMTVPCPNIFNWAFSWGESLCYSWLAAISRIDGQACKGHSAPHPVPLLDAPRE